MEKYSDGDNMIKQKGVGKTREWKITYGGTVQVMGNTQEEAIDNFFQWYQETERKPKPKIIRMEVVK